MMDFMDQGKDALVIYDDLSKHADAYRHFPEAHIVFWPDLVENRFRLIRADRVNPFYHTRLEAAALEAQTKAKRNVDAELFCPVVVDKPQFQFNGFAP